MSPDGLITKVVCVESPYADNVRRNVGYARRAVLDCLSRGEAPFAGHLLYTQRGVLDDSIAADRRLGISAHLAFLKRCDLVCFYTDYGWSHGMEEAWHCAKESGIFIEYRQIGRNPNILKKGIEGIAVLANIGFGRGSQ